MPRTLRRRHLLALLTAGLATIRATPRARAEMKPSDMPGGACDRKELACASSATPLMLSDGTLWLAWAAGGSVSVARSSDGGRSFSDPAVIDPVARVMDNGPDARPKIVRNPVTGRITVAYSVFKDENWNAEVLVSSSIDDGRSFAPPRALSADPASQRFEALELTPSGTMFAAWTDKRGAAAAEREGRSYPGAALAYAWSDDGGASWSEARIAQDNSCECCRLALALTGNGTPVVMFRTIYGGHVRDHAVTTFTPDGQPGPIYRVSVDDWAIDGCPHHGPSLAVSTAGTYHAAWFTLGRKREGVFYARSTDGGRSFSAPRLLATPAQHGGRPFVLAEAGAVWLAWKEFDGERTTVRTQVSHDDGVTWSVPVTAAGTGGESDHPLLVTDGSRTFLSWMTHGDGYRLVPLDAAS